MDTAEICGGPRFLMTLLTQVGPVAFTDMHDHFVTAVAEHQSKECVWNNVLEKVFTIASADKSHSYHGTAIQIMKPDLKLVLNTHVHKGVSQTEETHTHLQSLPTCSLPESQTVTSMLLIPLRKPDSHSSTYLIPLRKPYSHSNAYLISSRKPGHHSNA